MKRQKKRWMAIAAGVGAARQRLHRRRLGVLGATVDPSASNAPVTVELTGEWTSKRECTEWQDSFKDGFESTYPWITVDAKCGITEEQQIAAINAGNPPDVFLSFGVDNVGKFCDTGAWTDLNQYIDDPDVGFNRDIFPAAALTYTSFEGTQCSLPFLTDTTGLYYNLDLFEQAGLSGPPDDDGRADRVREGAHRVQPGRVDRGGRVRAGHDYYCCSSNLLNLGHMFGASYLDESGAPAYASDPAWAEMFQWQHDFIAEVYGDGDFQTGADKLQKFVAGAGNEWGSAPGLPEGPRGDADRRGVAQRLPRRPRT